VSSLRKNDYLRCQNVVQRMSSAEANKTLHWKFLIFEQRSCMAKFEEANAHLYFGGTQFDSGLGIINKLFGCI
jgi:hypothetical protein